MESDKHREVLARVQDTEDRLVARFCAVSRRLVRKMDWVSDTASFSDLEEGIRAEIRFYEGRGFYLFQEPWLDHEPFARRFRVVLTFRPTEGNR